MKSKKKEDFDYQSFEQAALKAMYEGKPLCLIPVYRYQSKVEMLV
jgi:hypothetical protein